MLFSARFIDLSDRVKNRLKIALIKDVKFLSSLGLMDYSLLLAIENQVKV
jgi:hypothetical protein